MTETKKEVEEMKEFMTVLMEVKVSLADQNGKLDSLLDMKPKVEKAYEVANSAERRSEVNEKSINFIQEKISKKADKEDVEKKADQKDMERMVKDKDNWKKNSPMWIAILISIVSILLQYN